MKRTVLITGANRGIGFATANRLAQNKDLQILLASRDPAQGLKAAQAIAGNVVPVTLNLGDSKILGQQITAILQEHEPVDVLINNAAVLHQENILDLDSADFDQALQVNLQAPFQLIKALAPGMIERGYGRIVNLSSGWGSFAEGMEGPSAYAITKAALNALTVSLAGQLPDNVKVNAVCPGWVRTRMGGDAATRSPEEGAETPAWLATLPNDGPSGGFFRDCQPINW